MQFRIYDGCRSPVLITWANASGSRRRVRRIKQSSTLPILGVPGMTDMAERERCSVYRPSQILIQNQIPTS